MTERRRGPALEAALLDAAWAELSECGYDGLTFDGVAKHAETSRAVLYRRWPDKPELVRAAIAHKVAGVELRFPDTGTLRGDLIAALREVSKGADRMIPAMMIHLSDYYDATGTTPKQLRALLGGARWDAVQEIYERAVQRGELRHDDVSMRLKELPFVVLRDECLRTRAPIAPHVIEEIVDQIALPVLRATQE